MRLSRVRDPAYGAAAMSAPVVPADPRALPGAPQTLSAEVRATARLAGPLVLSNLAQTLIYATDVLMIGWLGPHSLAASALAVNLFSVLLFTGTGLVSAAAPLIASELGARRHSVREVRRTVRMALWAALVYVVPCWLLLWNARPLLIALGQDPALAAEAARFLHVVQWGLLPALGIVVLRTFVSALGRPLPALVVTLAGVAINAALNWGLIFGHLGLPALGLEGSALASAITQAAMLLILIAIVLGDRGFRRYRLFGNAWRFDPARFREVWRIGLPIAATLAFEVTVFSAAVYLMGLISQASIAAHAVALQIAAVTFMVPLGLSQAVTIRVGMAYGARDLRWIGWAGTAALTLAMGFMALAALGMWLFPHLLVGLFLDPADPANGPVIPLAISFLGIAAIFQLADGAQVVGAAMLRGLHDTRVPMLFAGFGYWVVGLGSGAWLAFGAGWQGIGVWTGLALGLATVAVLMQWRWSQRARLGLLPAPSVAG
jgi:MATE family multidrug resistance protein